MDSHQNDLIQKTDNNSPEKKTWQKPELTVLKQSKTETGTYPAMEEDFGGTVGTS